jgi:predicted transcriptional regulator
VSSATDPQGAGEGGRNHLGKRRSAPYLSGMASAPVTEQAETEEQRRARLAWEEAELLKAEEEAEREGTIPAEEVHAWILSLDTPNPLPMPQPRHD